MNNSLIFYSLITLVLKIQKRKEKNERFRKEKILDMVIFNS